MDWKDLGGTLIRAGAPIIGTALGGPLGGTLGGVLGNVLANALGVDPTPEAVNNAIQNSPADVVAQKLQLADSEAAAKWQAIAAVAQAEAADRTAQSQAINETIRAEIASGTPWYYWRNLWCYSVTAECTAVGCIILWNFATGDFKAIDVFLKASNFFYTWYTMRIGVLGFIFRGASNEKIAAVTGEVPGVIGRVIKAVKGK